MSNKNLNDTVTSPVQKEERNHSFDTFRGILICTIPLSHFTMMGGHFSQWSLGGFCYVTINVFVMQSFVFLSGYYSKKPARARETAFKTFLFPYLMLVPFFYFVRLLLFGNSTLNWLEPPLALWYLVALFFYRFLLLDFARNRFLLELSILAYLVAGMIPWLSSTLSLGRVVSYFPFFVLGYFCQKEHIEKIRNMKLFPTIVLGLVLFSVSMLLIYFQPVPRSFYLLSRPDEVIHVEWYTGLLMRVLIFLIASGWICFMLRIMPCKYNYLTYIGMNSMSLYILHLVVRQILKASGGVPDTNWLVYYGSIFGLAILCDIVLSSPPVSKAYNYIMDDILYGKIYLSIKDFFYR